MEEAVFENEPEVREENIAKWPLIVLVILLFIGAILCGAILFFPHTGFISKNELLITRIALVIGFFILITAVIAVFNYRQSAMFSARRADDIEKIYELQRENDELDKANSELEMESQIRSYFETKNDDLLRSLKEELSSLRENLNNLSGISFNDSPQLEASYFTDYAQDDEIRDDYLRAEQDFEETTITPEPRRIPQQEPNVGKRRREKAVDETAINSFYSPQPIFSPQPNVENFANLYNDPTPDPTHFNLDQGSNVFNKPLADIFNPTSPTLNDVNGNHSSGKSVAELLAERGIADISTRPFNRRRSDD